MIVVAIAPMRPNQAATTPAASLTLGGAHVATDGGDSEQINPSRVMKQAKRRTAVSALMSLAPLSCCPARAAQNPLAVTSRATRAILSAHHQIGQLRFDQTSSTLALTSALLGSWN